MHIISADCRVDELSLLNWVHEDISLLQYDFPMEEEAIMWRRAHTEEESQSNLPPVSVPYERWVYRKRGGSQRLVDWSTVK